MKKLNADTETNYYHDHVAQHGVGYLLAVQVYHSFGDRALATAARIHTLEDMQHLLQPGNIKELLGDKEDDARP
jgi:hypothetical protein